MMPPYAFRFIDVVLVEKRTFSLTLSSIGRTVIAILSLSHEQNAVVSLRVPSFGMIWMRISDPRSFGSGCIKGNDKSLTRVDSSVPLMRRAMIWKILDHCSWSRSPPKERIPSHLMLQKPEVSTCLVGHLAHMQTLPIYAYLTSSLLNRLRFTPNIRTIGGIANLM